MDHFEGIVASLLERDGWWVRRSFKVNLTTEEKKRIGKPTMPRAEIDVLALHHQRNEIIALEVKSFLDSTGVKLEDLMEIHEVPSGKYKMFTCENYRNIVLTRLREDLLQAGMVDTNTSLMLGLAAGNIRRGEEQQVRDHIMRHNWFFLSPDDVRQKLQSLSSDHYENDCSMITAKILLRDH